MRSSILFGLFAALCNPANGLVFRDKIKKVVDGTSLYLNGSAADAEFVKLDSEPQGWEFNTEGRPDDQAVITHLDSNRALVCLLASKCELAGGGLQPAFRVTRVDDSQPIFTFQDPATSLYVSVAPDMTLELTAVHSDAIFFQLEKI